MHTEKNVKKKKPLFLETHSKIGSTKWCEFGAGLSVYQWQARGVFGRNLFETLNILLTAKLHTSPLSTPITQLEKVYFRSLIKGLIPDNAYLPKT